MPVTKTIIDSSFGTGFAPLQSAEKTDQLVHSKGVRLDLPGYSWVLLSGFASTDSSLKEVIAPGDYAAQTRQTLTLIQQALQEQGGSIDDIVRMRVYVVGLTDEAFRQIHEVRAEFFVPEHYPASTLVEVSGLALPGLLIEIDTDSVLIPG